MAVTIKDIAKKVGVSPSTVSRVLNGNSVISKETQDKIMEAIALMDYHPNSLARNFANGSTYSIGMVIDAQDDITFSNAFFNRSVYAIERVVQEKGYSLLITSNGKKGMNSAVEKLVLERKADGIILPSSLATKKMIQTLKKNKFPFIILGEPTIDKTNTSWVDINNEMGAENATDHLIKCGYKNIGFILENQTTIFAQKRVMGYKNSLSKNNAGYDEGLIRECGDAVENAYEITKEFLAKANRPDAILCANNAIAYQVLRATKECGLSVPNEIGIMTFDNYPFAEYMDPPLSAVDVDTYQLGEQAALALFRMINDENADNQQTVIATKLLIRESTNRA